MIATPIHMHLTVHRLVTLGLSAALLAVSTTGLAQAPAPAASPNAGTAPAAGEPLVTKRVASLRDEPNDNARSLRALPVQSQLMRLGDKQGPWMKVRTDDGAQGWVHMFDVTLAATASSTGSAGAGVLRSVTSFFNRGSAVPRNSNVATSTVGIRGLNAQDIANATPNPQALQQAESFRLDAAQAGQFASVARLSRQSVAALPQVAAPSIQTAPSESSQ